MGEEERAALIAEANPQQARTDENEVATASHIEGLAYDDDEENEPTIAQPPPSMEQDADLTVPYPGPGVAYADHTVPLTPLTERMPPQKQAQRGSQRPQEERLPMSTTNVGPPPAMRSRPPPTPVQHARREMHGGERAPHSAYDDRPPSVEINATPPPMTAIEAQHAMSDGYLRIPQQQFPGGSSYPPPMQPIPPTAQTYMISPKVPQELSTAMWLLALALAVVGIAVIYSSWSRGQNATPVDGVTPATATIPTANATIPTSTTTTVNPQDLPQSVTGVIPQTTRPPHGKTQPPPRGGHKVVNAPPPVTQNVDPQPPPQPPVAGGSGFLTVICTPACDEVLDGNSSLGPSPVFKAQVRSGSHRITLKTTDPPDSKVVSVTVPTDDTAVVKQAMGN